NSSGNSNVICSGSRDNTIRFWDIQSNKNELYAIKGDDKEVMCLKLLSLKKKEKNSGNTKNIAYDLNLCYEMKAVFLKILIAIVLNLFDL
ncbi:hypothetical protein RFI_31523, partial [Reticulomyxa filosa]